MSTASDQANICSSDENPYNACRSVFINKTAAGLCARCFLLLNAKDENDRATKETWPQCEDCGAISMMIPKDRQTCGGCFQKRSKSASTEDSVAQKAAHAQQLKEEERRTGMTARNLIGPNKKASDKFSGNRTSTAAAAGVPRSITVVLVPTAEKANPKARLGIPQKEFPETATFYEVIDELIQDVNVTWDKACPHSLTQQFITLKFFGSRNPVKDSDASTLGDFYRINDSALPSDLSKRTPGTIKLKAPFIYLEAIIMVQEFEDHFHCEVPHYVLAPTEKNRRDRKRDADAADLSSNVSSKAFKSHARSFATAIPLQSSFRPAGYTDIQLAVAQVKVNDYGEITVLWPDLKKGSITLEPATISDKEFAHGKTQRVYLVNFRNSQWVAKRFYETGAGPDNVDLDTNKMELEKEGKRLTQTGWFFKHFEKLAEEREVEIGNDLAVAEFLLALEVVGIDGEASPASNVTQNQFQERIDSNTDSNAWSLAWLLEKKRSKSSNKWSGTNAHPAHHNKLGNILNAFSHFVYLWSKSTVVLADIQTSAHGSKQVLFDMMTHTPGGDSGVGDHGQDGIDIYVKSHQCVTRCKQLQLPPLEADEDNGDESEQE